MKAENLTVRELTATVKSVVPTTLLEYLTAEQKSELKTIDVNYIQAAPFDTDTEDEDLQEIEVIGTINDSLKFTMVLNWSIENDVMFANYEPTFE